MDNEKCLEMFQNIKKQISDQAVFNLTGKTQGNILGKIAVRHYR